MIAKTRFRGFPTWYLQFLANTKGRGSESPASLRALIDRLKRNLNATENQQKTLLLKPSDSSSFASDLDYYERAIRDYRASIKAAEEKLVKLSKTPSGQSEDARKGKEVFVQLSRHAKVHSIWASRKFLFVLTKPLWFINGHYDKEPIGRFLIQFSTTGSPLFSNLDFTQGGYGHPHVSGRGACMGTYWDELQEARSGGNLYPLVNGIFAFLQMADNPDTAYVDHGYWFEQRERVDGYKRYGLHPLVIRGRKYEKPISSLFGVGDRVTVTAGYESCTRCGTNAGFNPGDAVGTIIEVPRSGNLYVEFDREVDHGSRGQYLCPRHLRKVRRARTRTHAR